MSADTYNQWQEARKHAMSVPCDLAHLREYNEARRKEDETFWRHIEEVDSEARRSARSKLGDAAKRRR